METKICTKCKETKTLDCFNKDKKNRDGLSTWCRECCSAQGKIYRKNNKDLIYKRNKLYVENNKDKVSKQRTEYYNNNKDKILDYQIEYRESNKDRMTERDKKYYQMVQNKRKTDEDFNKKYMKRIDDYNTEYYKKNKDKLFNQRKLYRGNNKGQIRKAESIKWHNDANFRLKKSMSQTFIAVVHNNRKSSTYLDKVGLTPMDIRDHLESLFTDGMTWDNYGNGGWEIDHIKPKHLFDHTDEKQLQECWSLSNLQPLWKEDNVQKGRKYDETEK